MCFTTAALDKNGRLVVQSLYPGPYSTYRFVSGFRKPPHRIRIQNWSPDLNTACLWAYRLKFIGKSPEHSGEDLLDVPIAELGEDDGDGEHGVAGVLLKPITLVTSCQTEKKLT